MRFGGLVIGLCTTAPLVPLLLPVTPAYAQYQAPSDRLVMGGSVATTWSTGLGEDVVQLEGPVRIELDRATLTANQAVLWLSADKSRPGTKRIVVALVGNAKVQQGASARSGERILVTADVAGKIQLKANDRVDKEATDSDLFKAASKMRQPDEPGTKPAVDSPAANNPAATTQPDVLRPPTRPSEFPFTRPATGGTTILTTRPTTVATTQPIPRGPIATTRPSAPITFRAPELEMVDAADGTIAVVLSQGVTLIHRRPNGDLLELQSDRAVVYTSVKNLRDLQKPEQVKRIQDAVTGAYLEGDVRVTFTPNKTPNNDQRLSGERVYYDFLTDRAVLTDAVIRTVEPKANIPIIVRAKTVRQLAVGEYKTEEAQLSTSSFAVPTYSINAEKIYVRQDPDDEGANNTVGYEATHETFKLFGLPIFYMPASAGTITTGQSVLRGIGAGHSSAFGAQALTEWGLFETFGQQHPRDLDATYRLDYHSDRGPGFGLNAKYQGGFITETSRQPWSFEGEFQSYFVYDHGIDDISRPLAPRPEDDYRLRGHALFEHQHYFPDGWTAQIRAGYTSDATFLEQWFPRDIDQGLPHDVSAYVKHQKDTEAFTLLVQGQPNGLITSSDFYQEQVEVEHLPEIGYHRIGDDLFGGKATFYSDNTVSGLHFKPTRATLAEQGFVSGVSPGLPSFAQTGTGDSMTYRADFRQEIDFPINAGRVKIVPYLMGRYTFYSDSPTEGTQNRVLGGAGLKMSTAFWKVDDGIESRLFDIHRVRHVIEPEVNLFTSAQTVDNNSLFHYDEQVDQINDISAASIAIRQRWQTYRGGPGRWRSVDFLTFNAEANFYANQPKKSDLVPFGFRGLYFPSLPESSIPRDSLNFDASWRISDNTVLLADASENIDGHFRLATANIGLITRRDERLAFYIGTRYIADLNSNITTGAIQYEISPKYSISITQSFDFSQGESVVSDIGIVRKFDTFMVLVRATVNETTKENSFGINLFPMGTGYGLDSGQFGSVLDRQR